MEYLIGSLFGFALASLIWTMRRDSVLLPLEGHNRRLQASVDEAIEILESTTHYPRIAPAIEALKRATEAPPA